MLRTTALSSLAPSAELRAPLSALPPTRYVGSKRRMLGELQGVFNTIRFSTAVDVFSGTGSVSWLLKAMGKSVWSNDVLQFPHSVTTSLLASPATNEKDVRAVERLAKTKGVRGTAHHYYSDVMFTSEECQFLDALSASWGHLDSTELCMTKAAIGLACVRKRPRGLFTQNFVSDQTRNRPTENANLRDLFIDSGKMIARGRFEGQQHVSTSLDALNLSSENHDLIYLDPPYSSLSTDSNYLRRYHFLEGLLNNWEGVEIDAGTTTKQVRVQFSRLDLPDTAISSIIKIFSRFPNSHWVLSFNSNSIYGPKQFTEICSHLGRSTRFYEFELVANHGTKKGKNGQLNNRVTEYVMVAEQKNDN